MLPGAVRTIQTNKRVPLVSSGNQPASTHMVFSHLCRGKVQSTLPCRACLRLAREWEFWRSLEHCSLLLNAHCPGLGGRLPSRRACRASIFCVVSYCATCLLFIAMFQAFDVPSVSDQHSEVYSRVYCVPNSSLCLANQQYQLSAPRGEKTGL